MEALKKNLHVNSLRLLAEFSSLGDRILAGFSLFAGAKEEHYSQLREVSCRSCHVTCHVTLRTGLREFLSHGIFCLMFHIFDFCLRLLDLNVKASCG